MTMHGIPLPVTCMERTHDGCAYLAAAQATNITTCTNEQPLRTRLEQLVLMLKMSVDTG